MVATKHIQARVSYFAVNCSGAFTDAGAFGARWSMAGLSPFRTVCVVRSPPWNRTVASSSSWYSLKVRPEAGRNIERNGGPSSKNRIFI